MNDQNAESIRGSLLWTLSPSFRSTTIVTYFHDDVRNGTKLAVVDPTRGPALGALTPVFFAQLQAALVRTRSLREREIENNISQTSRNRVFAIQNVSELTLSDHFTLKNIVGYRHIKTNWANDLDGSALDTLRSMSSIDARQFSDELQVVATFNDLKVVGGLFYWQLDDDDITLSPIFSNFAPLAPTAFPTNSDTNFGASNKSYAAFLHADYTLDSIAQGLSLSAGIRVTRDTRGIRFRNRTGVGFNQTLPVLTCTLTGAKVDGYTTVGCDTPASRSFTEPTWDVSLNYQANRNVLVYLAHRHGYRSGGFNTSPTSLAQIPNFSFEPEKVDDFELGVKSTFKVAGVQARWNVAAYYSSIANAQRSIQVGLPNGSFVNLLTNAAKAHVTGLESELTVIPAQNLTLSFNASYTDPRYDSWLDNYRVAGVITPIDISDSQFAFVPKYQLSGTAAYEVPLSHDAGKIGVQATAFYQTAVQTAEINTTNCGSDGLYPNCHNNRGRLPGYAIVNARATWKGIAGTGADVALFVDNIGDKLYSNDAQNGIGPFGYQSVTIAPPRTYGIEVRYSF